MSRYRKVQTQIWNDEKFRHFTDDGKLAFLYLLTHPAMTSIGAMRGTPAGLAAELGWELPRFERALAPATEQHLVEINAGASFIGLPNFLKHNEPESPNVCKAWVSAIALLPECHERTALVQRCRDHLAAAKPFREAFEQAFKEAFGQAFKEAFGQSSPNPRTENQEPKPEQERTLAVADAPAAPTIAEEGTAAKSNGKVVHPTLDLLEEYARLFEARFKVAPQIDRPKDGKLAKELLRNHTITELKGALPRFFALADDDFVVKNGWTFGMFKTRVNKCLIDSQGRGARVPPRRSSDTWAGQEFKVIRRD